MIYIVKAAYTTPTIFLLHKKQLIYRMKAAFKKHSHTTLKRSHTTLTLVEFTSHH